jgi:hypothetical protein
MATRESRSPPAPVQCLRQLLEGEVGQAHRHVMLAAEGGGKGDVLVSEAQRESGRLVLAAKELLGQPVEGPLAPERALPHGLPERQRLQPAFTPSVNTSAKRTGWRSRRSCERAWRRSRRR